MLEITNKTQHKVNQKKASKITDALLNFYKIPEAEVSLVIIGDKKMHTLNREYRGIDKTTDVLSFSTNKSPKYPTLFLGEIFININEATRSKKYLEVFGEARSKEYIFFFLLVHGLLHLLGYDDKTEKTRNAMITIGEKFLSGFFKKVI